MKLINKYALCVFVILISCRSNGNRGLISESKDENENITRVYSVNGSKSETEVFVFDRNEKLIGKYYQKNGKMSGHYFSYFDNGKPRVEGLMLNGKKDGWFKYYNSQGDLIALREYINFQDTSIARLNRVIKFGKNGDTLKGESFFYRILSTKDTISVDQEFSIKIILESPLPEVALVYLCDYDSVYNLQLNGSCDSFLMKNNQLAIAPLKHNKGENYIRGSIYYYGQSMNDKNDRNLSSAELYFSVKYFVR